MEVNITTRKNEQSFEIKTFIEFLNAESLKGATHLRYRVASDPHWPFEWVETFRIKSDAEINKQKVKELETELARLKGRNTNDTNSNFRERE